MNGLSALISPQGAALMQKKQQMDPEQYDQLLQQYVASGLLPFSEVVALKQQADYWQNKAKMGAATPPQSTVVQDLQQQIAPAQQGIGALPAAAAPVPQMAGGGIVAFADGSDVFGKRGPLGSPIPEEAVVAEAAAPAAAKRSLFRRILSGALPASAMYQAYSTAKTPQEDINRFWGKGTQVGTTDKGEPVFLEDVIGGSFDPTGLSKGITNLTSYLADPEMARDLRRRAASYGLRAATFGQLGTEAPEAPAVPALAPAEEGMPVAPEGVDLSQYYSEAGGLGGLPLGRMDVRGQFADSERQLRDMMAEAKQETASGPRRQIEERMALQKEFGLDQPLTEQEKRLSKREEKLGKEEKRSKSDALAHFFFTMAANATKPGATALAAAAESAPEGLAEFKRIRKELNDNRDKLEDARFALEMERNKLKGAAIDVGSAEYNKALDRYQGLVDKRLDLKNAIASAQINADQKHMDRQLEIATTKVRAAGGNSTFDRLMDAYVKAGMKGDIKAQKYFLDSLTAIAEGVGKKKEPTDLAGRLAGLEGQSGEPSQLSPKVAQAMQIVGNR